MTGFTGKVKTGEMVVPVRWWMPNDNGGGSSMYRRVDRIEYVKPKSVRYSFKQSVLSKYFKKTRAKVTVMCLKDHALRKVTPQDDHECDMCNKEKPRWTCQGDCHYDLCTECHEMMGVQRSLLPSTRAEINNHMPNVAVDPHEEGKPPCLGDDCTWHAEFKLEKAMNVQDIALELQVSQSHLIEHNYKEGWNLTPATVFSKGTTLWQPGGQKKQSPSGDEDGDGEDGDDEDGDDEDGDDEDGDDKDGYYDSDVVSCESDEGKEEGEDGDEDGDESESEEEADEDGDESEEEEVRPSVTLTRAMTFQQAAEHFSVDVETLLNENRFVSNQKPGTMLVNGTVLWTSDGVVPMSEDDSE